MKCLFIRCSKPFSDFWDVVYANHPEVFFVRCHSVEKAVEAVIKHQPDLVLFEHHLTPLDNGGGHEGFKILDTLKELGLMEGRLFYTTTSDHSVLPQYEALGIKKVTGSLHQAILRRDPQELFAQLTLA